MPRPKDLFKKSRDNKIRKEFDGYNYTELANKFDLTEVWIRKIVRRSDSHRVETDDGADKGVPAAN